MQFRKLHNKLHQLTTETVIERLSFGKNMSGPDLRNAQINNLGCLLTILLI